MVDWSKIERPAPPKVLHLHGEHKAAFIARVRATFGKAK